MTFDDLRALFDPTDTEIITLVDGSILRLADGSIAVRPKCVNIPGNVRVRTVKDLYWSDGVEQHLHAKAGEEGTVLSHTGAGLIVHFDSGEHRQVIDVDGKRCEDEII
jgi:hypothetical protein